MNLRIERQSFRVDTVVGEGAAQSVVEGSVSLPDGAPEIGRLLRVRAHPVITQYDVVDERITIDGSMNIEALYASFTEVDSVSEEDEQPEVILEERLEMGHWSHALPFTCVLDVTGAEAGMQAKVAVYVESINSEVQSDHRSINVDVILNLAGNVYRVEEHILATSAFAAQEVHTEMRQVRLQLAAVSGRGQARVEGFLPFGGRALPSQVLDLVIRPSGTPSVRLSSGVAEVTSGLTCSLLYTAEEVGAAYVEWPDELFFQSSVSLSTSVDEGSVDVSLTTADVQWSVVDSEERRGLAVAATVLAQVQVTESRTADVITDLTTEGPVGVVARKQWLLVAEAVGEGRLTTVAEANLQIPTGALPIEKVLLNEAAARVEDVHVLGDKVAIEGAASLDLIYVGRSGDTTCLTTCSWPTGIPFEVEVPIPGAEPGLERKVELRVDRVSVGLINRETVAVELDIMARVALSRDVEIEHVVEATEVPPPDPNPPTYTFVVLQAGDTLWQIAQKYHTELSAIVQANKWLEDEDSPLPPGAKLCIPRGRQ